MRKKVTALRGVSMSGSNKIGQISKRQNFVALLLSISGVALNVFFNMLVKAVELPLYLDTVGTIVVAALGGYFPGVLVGFLTNILKGISTPSSLYYGVLNVMIAFVAAFVSHRGWFKKLWGIVGATALFIIIGGGIGSLIPFFMDGLSYGNDSLSEIIYETGYFGPVVSYVLSRILMEIPDKILTVAISIVILRLIPDRYFQIYNFDGWTKVSFYDESIEEDKREWRLVSLRGKMIALFSLSMVALYVVAASIGVQMYQETIIEEYTKVAQSTAAVAAEMIDADMVDAWLQTGGEGSGYAKTKQQLENVLENSVDIQGLYAYKTSKDGCRVVFNITDEEDEADTVGTFIEYNDTFVAYASDLMAGKEIEPLIVKDEDGSYMTVFEPIFDSDGNFVCYMTADVDMSIITAMCHKFLMKMTSVFSAFLILLLVVLIWVTEMRITLPINAMTGALEKYSVLGSDQEEMDENVKRIRRLEIHTGDEVERLYNTICKMVANQEEQMRSIRRLSDSTAKMQDGLIITMADMVENRDSDTGAHIQKTAAYVKIIVEALKKKGYYAEKMTPKFMSDVVRSAPLHDIGKINIPDEVLNKPGKLSEEEFEIMKTHTTKGKQIMEQAISTVEGDNYLKEARNMAAYHHERWDGTGYPEQLHGEVIPLSARIMAVADVFDALTSARVYKPAFPIEKAISIIEEGKGTQFDPKCVEAFVDSLDEVKVVLQKYSQEMIR